MGYLIDTCVWVAVERGRVRPADVAAVTGSRGGKVKLSRTWATRHH
jgi:hypothetical protein